MDFVYMDRLGWDKTSPTVKTETGFVKSSTKSWRDSPVTVVPVCWCIGSQIHGCMCAMQKTRGQETHPGKLDFVTLMGR